VQYASRIHRPPRTGKTISNRIDEFVNQHDTPLGNLLKHAAELDRLDRQLSGLLSPQLSQNCQVADLRDGCLTLVSPAAVWATQLRFQSADIVHKLNETSDSGIRRIVIRIAPIRRPKQEQRRKKGLPPAAVEALQRFAEDSGDPEIKSIVHDLNCDRDGK
jgi:hypothetical protein